MRGMTDTTLAAAPRAAKKLSTVTHHGITVEDHYAWLRDPGYPNVTDPDVLAYLNAENAYYEAAFAEPNKALIDSVFEEMKGRIKEDLSSVPLAHDDFEYWWAFQPGAQYRQWFRRKLGHVSTPPLDGEGQGWGDGGDGPTTREHHPLPTLPHQG